MSAVKRNAPIKEEFQQWALFVNGEPVEDYEPWEFADSKYSLLSENEVRDIQEHLQEKGGW